MACITTKYSTHKTKFKSKCVFSSNNETFQFLKCQLWRSLEIGDNFKGIPMPKLELLINEFQELIVPCYPPMIPSTLIDAIPNVNSWVHQLTSLSRMHVLIFMRTTQIYVEICNNGPLENSLKTLYAPKKKTKKYLKFRHPHPFEIHGKTSILTYGLIYV